MPIAAFNDDYTADVVGFFGPPSSRVLRISLCDSPRPGG
jgi:hypothetical protein